MENAVKKSELVDKLRNDILSLQGFRPQSLVKQSEFGLGPLEKAFPYGVFPTGAIHEFLSDEPQQSAATSGFMAALAGRLMKEDGICLWISTKRAIFPPGLPFFGIAPERVIFLDLKKERDLLWMIEEGLKCDGLSAVVGEIKEINLTDSRRLQLAVEQSHVTGLLHRINPRSKAPVAAVCRWKINSLAGDAFDKLPGVGFPRWDVELLKVRHGEPGKCQLQWNQGRFEPVTTSVVPVKEKERLRQVG